MSQETKLRSVAKALSWRVLATLTTAAIVLLFTGEIGLAITVGSLEVVAKMGLYFMHERLWQRVQLGNKEIPSFVLHFDGISKDEQNEIGHRLADRIEASGLHVHCIDKVGILSTPANIIQVRLESSSKKELSSSKINSLEDKRSSRGPIANRNKKIGDSIRTIRLDNLSVDDAVDVVDKYLKRNLIPAN